MKKKHTDAVSGGVFHRENFRRRSRYTAVFLLLFLAFLAITILNINTGSTDISVGKILEIIFNGGGDGRGTNIIWKIRLPRILMAAILGGALSLSGFFCRPFLTIPLQGHMNWESPLGRRWW